MADVLISNLDRDGETRSYVAHGHAVVGSAGAASLLKGVFEPGWRWSTDVAPLVGTATCQVRHLGYVLSGSMHVVCEDGSEADLQTGDLFDLPPGHDAWVTGSEACIMVDQSSDATSYATAREPADLGEPDPNLDLVRRGYAAFNAKDMPALMSFFASDVVQHSPGHGPTAGEYKGVEAVLGLYGKLGELTGGTFRADLVELHGDGMGHVAAVHQITATRNGVTRVSRGAILFTIMDGRATDLLEMHADLAGDDAFLS